MRPRPNVKGSCHETGDDGICDCDVPARAGEVASAEPPLGVGAATIETGFDCYAQTLATGDGVTPLYPGTDIGAVLVKLTGNTRIVIANSANGSSNLTCNGQIEFGSTVPGYDPATFAPIGDVTVSTIAEGCAALEPVFPDVCRGNGAAIVTTGSTGTRCNIAAGLTTSKWRAVTSPSGRTVVSCHYPE